eukprot:scaffold518_cov388-Prasinococcus_capsulatus_cf.AAC.71
MVIIAGLGLVGPTLPGAYLYMYCSCTQSRFAVARGCKRDKRLKRCTAVDSGHAFDFRTRRTITVTAERRKHAVAGGATAYGAAGQRRYMYAGRAGFLYHTAEVRGWRECAEAGAIVALVCV